MKADRRIWENIYLGINNDSSNKNSYDTKDDELFVDDRGNALAKAGSA